jgi:hypothetical protein
MNATPDPQALPKPALVNWLGYIAVALLLMLPVAVLTVRSGAWQQGLLIYALSCLGAAMVLLLAGILMLLPRFANWRAAILGRALITLPGTALLLLVLGGGDYPPIHDVSTNLTEPPVFTAAAQQRGAGSNSLDIDPKTHELQAEGYPDLQTLRSTLAFDEMFDRALAVAGEMGWEVYYQDRNAGLIEAVDTTAVMAFKDDVVIRIRTNADGTLVDLRSVSRVGVGDIGANAKRIRAFLGRLQQGA